MLSFELGQLCENLSMIQNWDFRILVVLGCTFKFFSIYKKIENLGFLNVDLARLLLTFPNLWKRSKVGIFKISLDCTSKYFLIL